MLHSILNMLISVMSDCCPLAMMALKILLRNPGVGLCNIYRTQQEILGNGALCFSYSSPRQARPIQGATQILALLAQKGTGWSDILAYDWKGVPLIRFNLELNASARQRKE